MTPADVPEAVDLAEPARIHLIGIGGAGMSSIAVVLAGMGHTVSGSDAKESAVLSRLERIGVTTSVGHGPENVGDVDVVVRSSAVHDDNPEVVAAVEKGVPVLDRTAFLPLIARRTPFLSISGTHGKTTTSSMTTVALEAIGERPGFIVGSRIHSLGASAAYTGGDLMVLEADESDGSFLAGPRIGALVTNIEPDHLDHWGSWDALVAGFHRFLDETDGPRVVCVDDPTLAGFVAASLRDGRPMIGYGLSAGADYRIISTVTTDTGIGGEVSTPHGTVHLQLAVPGMHNLLNSTGALALVTSLGHDADRVADALGTYRGVARRFEARGKVDGIELVDDYAHHPTELRAAIAAGRSRAGDRLVAVFQPHRYTRTKALWDDFATAFDGIDLLVVTDIYPAGEPELEGVSSAGLSEAIRTSSDVGRVEYRPTLVDAAELLAAEVGAGDLVVSLGAGDVTTMPDLLIALLEEKDDRTDDGLVSALESAGLDVVRDHPLGPLCTYRVGGSADVYVRIESLDELSALARVTSDLFGRMGSQAPDIHVIGKGSNLLVSDRGVRGLVVQLGPAFGATTVVERSEDRVIVRVGGAALLPATARKLASDGIVGFEWAVGIPGSIGGAVRMNAGGHGSEISSVLRRVHVVDLHSGEARWMEADRLELAYRHSILASHQIVTEVELGLAPGDPGLAGDRLSEIVHWRRDHQPGGPNAGSVFTNPPGESAGRLIDTAGCRGLRVGTAEVSDKHANFIQADPGGRADDVMELMKRVVERVEVRHGVTLHAETVLLGFPSADVDAVKAGTRGVRP